MEYAELSMICMRTWNSSLRRPIVELIATRKKKKYSRVAAYLVTKQPPLGIRKGLSDGRGYS